jgi:hypothetical protein
VGWPLGWVLFFSEFLTQDTNASLIRSRESHNLILPHPSASKGIGVISRIIKSETRSHRARTR